MRHYLVVANQTLGQPQLTQKLLKCAAPQPADFHVLVPATHAHDHDRWTPGQARAIAGRRMEGALDRQGLPQRIEQAFHLPVTHVVAPLQPENVDERAASV